MFRDYPFITSSRYGGGRVGQNITIDHSLKGGGEGADNCMTVWKKCKYTKRDRLNFAKDLSFLHLDLKWSLASN